MKVLMVMGLLMFTGASAFANAGTAEASGTGIYKGSAVLVVKPQYVADFKREVLRIIAPTRLEAGNISYEAYQVLDERGMETNRFEFHELWRSEKAMMIDHKENSPHMKRFFGLIKIGQPDSWVETFEVSGKVVQLL